MTPAGIPGKKTAKDPLPLQSYSPVNATESRCDRDSPYHPGDLLHPAFWLSLDPPTRSPLEVWGRRLGTSRLNSRPEPETRELRLDNQEPRPGAGEGGAREERGNGDTTRKQGHTHTRNKWNTLISPNKCIIEELFKKTMAESISKLKNLTTHKLKYT